MAILAGLGLVVGLLLVYGLPQSTPLEAPPKKSARPKIEVPIGSILMLTGDYRSLAELVRDGQRIAIEELNSRDDSTFEYRLVVEDSRGDEQIAEEKVRALKKRGVDFIAELMGTDLALHCIKTVEEQRMLLISGLNTGPQLTAGAPKHFFRIISSDEVAVESLVRWAIELKLTRAAVVYRNDRWGRALRDAFREAYPRQGGTVALELEASEQLGIARRMAQAIEEARADVVALFVRPSAAGVLVAVCARLGVKTRFIGTDTLTGAEIHATGGEAVEGVMYVVPRSHPSEQADRFKRRFADYRRRAGHSPLVEPPLYAVMGYDGIHVLARGIEAGGAKVNRVIRALESLEHIGVSGPIAFSESHERKLAHPYGRYAYVTVDGKIEPREVAMAEPAAAEAEQGK